MFSLYFDIYRDIIKLPIAKQIFYLKIFAKRLKIFREGLSFPMINVKALADAHYDELVKLRRYFHEHPEYVRGKCTHWLHRHSKQQNLLLPALSEERGKLGIHRWPVSLPREYSVRLSLYVH